MRRQTVKNKSGFTLIELTMVLAIASVVMFGMGIALVDSQRGWNRMYNRAHEGVTSDGYIATKTFEAVVRKSSMTSERLGDDEIEVYYYDDPESSVKLDRYARFYKDDTELLVDYGELNSQGHPHERVQTLTLARNVESVGFSIAGTCIQMVLQLDDGSESLTVMAAAIRQNE